MKRSLLGLMAFLLLGAGLANAQAPARTPKPLTFSEPFGVGPVYIVPIDGMIDNGLARYLDRALADAIAADAALVIFEVDTFGGLVDAADRIRKAILNAPMPTVAFINRNAASAGALISYAADRIVMVPGASIGAATVVEGTGGEAAPDKYQSYMRGLMRATAEANGRDPAIAEAMVDETLEVDGVSTSGKVLTLSANEALALGVADAILETKEELLEQVGLTAALRVPHQLTQTERILRFFGSPVLQSILMLMMLGGLYFELQTPGIGFAGLMAVLGAALFFAPNYALGLVESWEILLFFVGVGLLVLEIFVIPGFGIAGIAGLLLVFGSLIAALIGNVGLSFPPVQALTSAVGTLAVTMVMLVATIIAAGRFLPQSERFKHLVLAPSLTSASGYTAAASMEALIGQMGTALTPLRPAGAADIEGERVDVVTGGEFIPTGTTVRVVKVRGSRVEVRATEKLPVANETSTV